MDYNLSAYSQASLRPSPVNKMTEQFAQFFREGLDINLGVGYVNDQTIPAYLIQKALTEVLLQPTVYRNALNYGGAEGSPRLRDAIRKYYCYENHSGLTEAHFANRRIVIGANGATSLLDAIADVLQPGIVVTTDPYYYIYCETLQRKGFRILSVPEDAKGIDPQAVEQALTTIDLEQLRFFYIPTVNNPTSVVLCNSRKKELVAIAARVSAQVQRKIPLVFDKAYEDIIHNQAISRPLSGILYDTQGLVFETGTLSKIIAPALRIGYMICPDDELARLIIQKTSDVGFSASLINQEIAAWLIDTHLSEIVSRVNVGYRQKAIEIGAAIEQQLQPWLAELRGGDAGFYYYLTFSAVETHEESAFYRFLTRTTGLPEFDGSPEANPRLIYIPGEHCVNPSGQLLDHGRRSLRISYGFETTHRVIDAISLIRQALEYASGC